jgi:Mg2+-importing ATPase
MGTGSNFGEMISAAGASFFLPFLPMTPVQLLLQNSLYDLSQLTIASDNVDPEMLIKPRHWDLSFIKVYMIFFGTISALYTFITFMIMINVFQAKVNLFQTAWFIEATVTEILVVFIIRTFRSPFFKSHPSPWLTVTCLAIVAISIVLPYSWTAKTLGFIAPPPLFFGIFAILISSYILILEVSKKIFTQKFQF